MTTAPDPIPDFEEMFSHRFTTDDQEYQEFLKRPADPPPVVEDWRNRTGGNQRYRDNRVQDRQYRERGERQDYSRNYGSERQWQGGGWENNRNQYRQGPTYPLYGQNRYHPYNRRPPYRDYY
ncbi:RNA guanine-N7 methyltransferase activating subunit [Microcaecilia unicolor]|uniref:RNA guanine-N7 methyltransferase activating subunit n=1 Tax=Microcaecilia unicolor TaxID=1415580 RepID=A0A6P7X4H8_9AMPH|nr:RNA guanine-N7 methyltransferase activating subunit [Microcaecilia unicolor]XP_030045470.1 RNA guanine-N7 methyltransferase activating subunit [Microcaecilia unicolor]